MIARYQKRLSGPLIDRIDLHLEVPRVEFEKLTDARLGESSETVLQRVEAARERMADRFRGQAIRTNAEMGPTEVRQFCLIDEAGQGLLKAAIAQLHLSARGFHRVLKLACTIADLGGATRTWRAILHRLIACSTRPEALAHSTNAVPLCGR